MSRPWRTLRGRLALGSIAALLIYHGMKLLGLRSTKADDGKTGDGGERETD